MRALRRLPMDLLSLRKDDMQIAMIAQTCYEVDGRVKRAAEALTESGHHVDIFAVSYKGISGSSKDDLLCIRRLRMGRQRTSAAGYVFEYGVFFAWAFSLVSLLNARLRYDVVYVHNMPNFLVFSGILPKVTGAKIVLDVHDPPAELLASIRGADLPPWLKRLMSAEERVSLSFSDAVITVSEPMRWRLATVSEKPVTVVMNLPDPAFSAPVGISRTEQDPDVLAYNGTIAHRHGLDLVVRAIRMLAGEFPLLRLRLIGGGPALESVVRLAAELGVADRLELRGFVPNDQIPSLVSTAVAGISPQREDTFGSLVFSMKVAEHIALGLPVICSGIATMRHYFSDDELLFFEPGNAADLARAIKELLTDSQSAQGRAARSRVKLRKLDWPAQRDALVETVEALGRPRKPGPLRAAGLVRVPWLRQSAVGGSLDGRIRR
jgi:glycosyltransferase involved in cell wall biosynthesis